jgi:hypothetical protein
MAQLFALLTVNKRNTQWWVSWLYSTWRRHTASIPILVAHIIRKTYRVLFTILVGSALTACATGPRYLPITLRTVTVIPDLRVAKTVYSDDVTDVAIEMGATRSTGRDSTAISAGPVRIGNGTFPGPQTIDTKFTFAFYDISARLRRSLHTRPFGYDVAAGFGYTDLHLAASSGTVRGDESVSSPAFRLAVGGMWRLRPTTHLEAHGDLFATNSHFRDVNRLEVALAQRLGSHATIRGGYSFWGLEAPDASRSAVTVRFFGPSIGFGLNF